MRSRAREATRRPRQRVLLDIAAYACVTPITSHPAYDTARQCLMDSLACAFMALSDPDCTRTLGTAVHGATLAGGARVPGTSYELEPVRAAFNIGAMIGWLGCNDTGLAVQGCHPADNLGGILAVADYLGRRAVAVGRDPPVVRDILEATIKAQDIRATLALGSRPDYAGLEEVVPVRLATTAVATAMLGASLEQVVNAVSGAWSDDVAPGTSDPGSGRRRAAWVATSRGVWHAFSTLRDETGCPPALRTPAADLGDASPDARPFKPEGAFGSHSLADARSTAESHAASARLTARFERSVAAAFPDGQRRRIVSLFADASRLDAMTVNEFVAQLVRN